MTCVPIAAGRKPTDVDPVGGIPPGRDGHDGPRRGPSPPDVPGEGSVRARRGVVPHRRVTANSVPSPGHPTPCVPSRQDRPDHAGSRVAGRTAAHEDAADVAGPFDGRRRQRLCRPNGPRWLVAAEGRRDHATRCACRRSSRLRGTIRVWPSRSVTRLKPCCRAFGRATRRLRPPPPWPGQPPSAHSAAGTPPGRRHRAPAPCARSRSPDPPRPARRGHPDREPAAG